MRLEKLKELPFDSFRKCMSLIVRDEAGEIHVLSKVIIISDFSVIIYIIK